MKLIATILLLFTFNTSYGMLSEQQIGLDGNPVIVFVTKNNVSSSITVHTYKYLDSQSEENVRDIDEQIENPQKIQIIIDAFSSVEGVSRCTFDRATHTFTILSSPTTSLSHVEELINKD